MQKVRIDENPPGPPGLPLVDDPETVVVELVPSNNAGFVSCGITPSQQSNRLSATASTPNPGDFVLGKKVSDPNVVRHTLVVEPRDAALGANPSTTTAAAPMNNSTRRERSDDDPRKNSFPAP